jgi:hypothetical protein
MRLSKVMYRMHVTVFFNPGCGLLKIESAIKHVNFTCQPNDKLVISVVYFHRLFIAACSP